MASCPSVTAVTCSAVCSLFAIICLALSITAFVQSGRIGTLETRKGNIEQYNSFVDKWNEEFRAKVDAIPNVNVTINNQITLEKTTALDPVLDTIDPQIDPPLKSYTPVKFNSTTTYPLLQNEAWNTQSKLDLTIHVLGEANQLSVPKFYELTYKFAAPKEGTDNRKYYCNTNYKGYWDASKEECTVFYVLKSVCTLINAETKKITKHRFATTEMGYGCEPGFEDPYVNHIRQVRPWTAGIYEIVKASETERKPEQTTFSRSGYIQVRDWNDPYVIGLYITNGHSFTPNIADFFLSLFGAAAAIILKVLGVILILFTVIAVIITFTTGFGGLMCCVRELKSQKKGSYYRMGETSMSVPFTTGEFVQPGIYPQV